MCIHLKFTLSKMAEKYQTDYPSLVWKRPKKIVVPVNLFKLFGVANTFAREVCHLCIIRKKHMNIVYTSFTFFILPMIQVVRKKKGCITIVSNLSWLLQSFQSKKKKQTSLFQSFRLIKKDNKTMPMQIFLGEAKFIVGCVNGELGREPGGS